MSLQPLDDLFRDPKNPDSWTVNVPSVYCLKQASPSNSVFMTAKDEGMFPLHWLFARRVRNNKFVGPNLMQHAIHMMSDAMDAPDFATAQLDTLRRHGSTFILFIFIVMERSAKIINPYHKAIEHVYDLLMNPDALVGRFSDSAKHVLKEAITTVSNVCRAIERALRKLFKEFPAVSWARSTQALQEMRKVNAKLTQLQNVYCAVDDEMAEESKTFAIKPFAPSLDNSELMFILADACMMFSTHSLMFMLIFSALHTSPSSDLAPISLMASVGDSQPIGKILHEAMHQTNDTLFYTSEHCVEIHQVRLRGKIDNERFCVITKRELDKIEITEIIARIVGRAESMSLRASSAKEEEEEDLDTFVLRRITDPSKKLNECDASLLHLYNFVSSFRNLNDPVVEKWRKMCLVLQAHNKEKTTVVGAGAFSAASCAALVKGGVDALASLKNSEQSFLYLTDQLASENSVLSTMIRKHPSHFTTDCLMLQQKMDYLEKNFLVDMRWDLCKFYSDLMVHSQGLEAAYSDLHHCSNIVAQVNEWKKNVPPHFQEEIKTAANVFHRNEDFGIIHEKQAALKLRNSICLHGLAYYSCVRRKCSLKKDQAARDRLAQLIYRQHFELNVDMAARLSLLRNHRNTTYLQKIQTVTDVALVNLVLCLQWKSAVDGGSSS